MKSINRPEDLHGLWPAIPTPWTADGGLDEAMLCRNVERHAAIPMDGVYTTDSDGEFYAMEHPQFRELARMFSKAVEPTNMGAAMGVTWTHTAGMIERIKICLDHGIQAVHVAFPFWMPLNAGDRKRFWEDLAKAAPQARWIHYNITRAGALTRGAEYIWMHENFPEQFIGTKMGSFALPDIAEWIGSTPSLAHFTVDYATVPALMLGARGSCSYWANTLPRWCRRMTDLCLEKRWEEAMAMQRKLLIWEATHVQPLRDAGYLHGILGRARGALTGFLEDHGVCRAPYSPVSENLQRQLQAAFDQYWADEIRK